MHYPLLRRRLGGDAYVVSACGNGPGGGTLLEVFNVSNPASPSLSSSFCMGCGLQAYSPDVVASGNTSFVVDACCGSTLQIFGSGAVQTSNLQEWRDYNDNLLDVINSSGCVGIGTANPLYALDVPNGTINAKAYNTGGSVSRKIIRPKIPIFLPEKSWRLTSATRE